MMKKGSWVVIRSSLIIEKEKQAKDSQKQKKKAILVYFTSASNVQQRFRKQGLKMCSFYRGRHTLL